MPPVEPSPRVTFRIPAWLLRRVETAARHEGRTLSNMLKRIVEWWAEQAEED